MAHPKHPDSLLAGRVAVVTGGAGGIGAATARLFAEHGADVVIADIDTDLADATAAAITESGGSALAMATDVRDPDQVAQLARTVLDRFDRVDVLVNNVGHWLRHPGNFVETDPSGALPNIPVQIFKFSESPEPAKHAQAWAAALVLIAFVLVISVAARILSARMRRRLGAAR